MKKYIKIYLALIRVNFATFIAYRGNFINSTLSSGVWSIFVILSMLLLTSRTSRFLGWTRNEILLLSAAYNIFYSIFYCFFSQNFEDFPLIVHLGRLDSILLKPISSQFLSSCWKIGFHNFLRFIVGLLFLLFILSQIHIHMNPVNIILAIIIGIASLIIIYSLWFIVITILIWFSRLSNLPEFLFAVNGIMRYPGEMYKNYSPVLYIILFPLTLVITVPIRILIGKATIQEILSILVVALVLFYCSHKFWHFALRFYTSASG